MRLRQQSPGTGPLLSKAFKPGMEIDPAAVVNAFTGTDGELYVSALPGSQRRGRELNDDAARRATGPVVCTCRFCGEQQHSPDMAAGEARLIAHARACPERSWAEAAGRGVAARPGWMSASEARHLADIEEATLAPCRPTKAEAEWRAQFAETLDSATRPATAEEYAHWLRGYMRAGGEPTHFYDYPFERWVGRIRIATGDFRTNGECGADSRGIIVPTGVRWLGVDPGHNEIYCVEPFRLGRTDGVGTSVPVFNDSVFDFAWHVAGVSKEKMRRDQTNAEWCEQQAARIVEQARRQRWL